MLIFAFRNAIYYMQKKISIVLPLIYGICIVLFFWKLFPHHLHYQEQIQTFLFTQDYFISICSNPGGFSNYTGSFFTQFFLSSFAGALFVSCLLTGIQLLIYAIIRRFLKNIQSDSPQLSVALFLSFLPSLYYWFLFCDENTHTSGIIALLLTLTSILAGTFLKSRFAHHIYLFIIIPILYWLAGGTVILSVLLLTGYKWIQCRKDTRTLSTNLILSIVAMCYAISLPLIAKLFLVQYPLNHYFWAVNYFRLTGLSPIMIGYLWILILFVVAGSLFLSKLKIQPKHTQIINPTKSVIHLFFYSIILFLAIYAAIMKFAYPQNLLKEEILAYNYHCRMQNWDRIIEMADRKSPTNTLAITCLNLALYKKGQLSNRMFQYYQSGPEGLLPNFQLDFVITMMGGEPYYYLGFVNAAQRFAIEAMEPFNDHQKSVRSIKRLVETNLINGYYEAASKHLYILEKTLFYRKWAKETRTYLYDEAKINAHHEWGEIRRFIPSKDFFFSRKEKDIMLGITFQQHPDNRMAYEYLMAYTLLTKEIDKFIAFYHMEKNFIYREIPKSYQEAMVYIWGLGNNLMDSIPIPVSNYVKQQVAAYAKIYLTTQSPEPVLRRQFSKTYWYYIHFRDYKQSDSENRLLY